MIKFEIKNKETGKKEQYTKDGITLGEVEVFWEHTEQENKERAKDKPSGAKVRKIQRDFLVYLFKDQGLTEEDLLKSMTQKEYVRVNEEIFREILGEDEEDSEDEEVQEGKNEEQPQ
ncbi:hypothetical protein BU107_05855 [Staphylococcus xylosus]|uniref:phage tail assembly chaperone G n=1 Tax=Staphylococcus xylosus TaxID=1288 RepID=UPI000E69D088|nr:hypothetical protein [Staphylococcus xylosus]RIM88324.1 hypothetical protein BU107_05855 [Staphylococcus xylosus]